VYRPSGKGNTTEDIAVPQLRQTDTVLLMDPWVHDRDRSSG
jgi:hypothetical protein